MSNYVNKILFSINRRRSITADTLNNTEPSATIHYSSMITHKFEPIYEPMKTHKPKDAIYKGICLPKMVTELFPSSHDVRF